ncbi:hypothetical protein GCM10017690_30030 [Microbacterium terregens]
MRLEHPQPRHDLPEPGGHGQLLVHPVLPRRPVLAPAVDGTVTGRAVARRTVVDHTVTLARADAESARLSEHTTASP